MIKTQKYERRKFLGEYRAQINDISVSDNQYYDPEKDNSSECVLDIEFILTDPESLEEIPFTQRFVSPLTHGKGLFQDILDVAGIQPDEEGMELDEQQLVGLKMIVNIVENKNGYSKVDSAKTDPRAKKPSRAKKEEPQEVEDVPYEDDLPFDQ